MKDRVTRKEKFCYILTNLGNVPVQAILGSYLLILYKCCWFESGSLRYTIFDCKNYGWFE